MRPRDREPESRSEFERPMRRRKRGGREGDRSALGRGDSCRIDEVGDEENEGIKSRLYKRVEIEKHGFQCTCHNNKKLKTNKKK